MKTIFFDIDGVLNSEKYYRKFDRSTNNWSRFDPEAVMYIKKLVEEHSAKIVITSTWRFGAVSMLNNELRKNELSKYLHKDGKTPQIYPPHRGTEIKQWMDKHPEITEYVIIDDDENILDEQKIKLVRTEMKDGLIEKHSLDARKIITYID